LAFRERLLDATVLARVEGQDGDPPTGLEAGRQLAEQGLQNTEFIVHLDPKSLKKSADAGWEGAVQAHLSSSAEAWALA
jgi:hypothetical protein